MPETPKPLPPSLTAAQREAAIRLGISGRYVPGVQTPPTLNLAAWARGEEEHIWPEVKRAINWYLHALGVDFVDFHERYQAVDWLIAEGFITAEEARKDVPRPPAGESAP
jgi:hypothetical protein